MEGRERRKRWNTCALMTDTLRPNAASIGSQAEGRKWLVVDGGEHLQTSGRERKGVMEGERVRVHVHCWSDCRSEVIHLIQRGANCLAGGATVGL